MNAKDRFTAVIEQLIVSGKVDNRVDFGKKIDKSKSQISQMEAGTLSVSAKTVHKIVNKFPEINGDWILSEEGEMLKSEHVAAAPAAGSATSTPPMGDDIRKLRDEISRLSGEVAELRKVILAQNSQLIELLKSEKSR